MLDIIDGFNGRFHARQFGSVEFSVAEMKTKTHLAGMAHEATASPGPFYHTSNVIAGDGSTLRRAATFQRLAVIGICQLRLRVL
jgi:hypothetical protein